jgi:hypothetical protein
VIENHVSETVITGPRILHEGRYRLYEKPDGGLRIQYKRDGSDQEDFMEIPGGMIRLAKMAGEGNLSFPQFLREAAKLRNEHLCLPRSAWTSYRGS